MNELSGLSHLDAPSLVAFRLLFFTVIRLVDVAVRRITGFLNCLVDFADRHEKVRLCGSYLLDCFSDA